MKFCPGPHTNLAGSYVMFCSAELSKQSRVMSLTWTEWPSDRKLKSPHSIPMTTGSMLFSNAHVSAEVAIMQV